MGGLVEELQPQSRLRLGRLCHHQQSARVLVDTVYQSHFGVIGVKSLVVFQVPGDGVDERAVKVAYPRVHHQSGGLVHHHQVGILVHHGQRYVFGLDSGVVAGPVEHQRHHVSGSHPVVALHRFVVYVYKSGVGGLLDAVAARVLHLLAHVLVDAERLLPFVHLETEVLVQLLLAVHLVYVVYL